MEESKIDLKTLWDSTSEEVRIPALVLKTISFFYEEEISTEDRIKIIRMLDAMYRD